MQFVKRVLCMVLAASCVFFTGCNSIIYNGDFRFQSFEPETLPPVDEWDTQMKEKVEETAERDEQQKYDIQGTDAFYILPGHDNRPDSILDFKVLDYTDQGRFIYAYLTPCYEENAQGTQAGSEGTAPEERVFAAGGSSTSNALVLMSYDPERRDYKVFYSSLKDKEVTETVVNESASEDVGNLTGSADGGGVMANRLVKDEAYFIFDGTTAYIYNKEGEEILHNDYGTVISQEVSRLKEKAKDSLKYKMPREEWEKLIEKAAVSVSDAVMDGEGYLYLSVTVELPETEGGGSDGLEEDAEEETLFTSVLACYDLNIGGSDSPVVFYSENRAWEKQVRLWKEVAEYQEVFESLDQVEDCQAIYSMDNIKTGRVDPGSVSYGFSRDGSETEEWVTGAVPDDFSPFRTRNSGLNMELAGIPNLFSFEVLRMSQNNKKKGVYRGTWRELVNGKDWEWDSGLRWYYWHWWYPYWWYPYNRSWDFWDSWYSRSQTEEQREKFGQAAKETLALLAQGDRQVMRRMGLSFDEGDYLLIPWLAPGQWEWGKKFNAMPYTQNQPTDLEALYAYKTTIYGEGEEKHPVSRYAGIDFADRYKGMEKQPKLTMEAHYQEGEEIARTFSYYESTVGMETDENGELHVAVTREVKTVTETLNLQDYPVGYRLIFPEKTRISWVEEVDTGEMAAPSGGLGCIYYGEKEGSGEDGKPYLSTIRYNDGGENDILSDEQMPGRAMDAGVLYFKGSSQAKETEIVCYVTDEGIKFYRRQGENFDEAGALYLSLDKLAQGASGYGTAKYGETLLTDSSEDERLSLSGEQDGIIRDNMEKGVSSDVLDVAGFSLLNERDVVIGSLSGGILLVNTDSGLVITLKPGAYYGAFPYSSSGERRFMVVGYNTQEYAYRPSDLALSKCYSMDLEAMNAALESQALKDHLDSLARNYLSRTHRLLWSESRKAYEIMEPEEDEKEANQQAERLFYGSEEDQERELLKMVSEMGFSGLSKEVREYGKGLRRKLLKQREALWEIYWLAGLGGVISFPAREAELLEQEGMLISAAYEKTLEHLLVDLKLSDRAIESMEPSFREEYRKYKQEKEAAVKLNDRGSGYLNEEQAQKALLTPWDPDMKVDDELAAMENMACYETVLNDIRRSYLDGLTTPAEGETETDLGLTADEREEWDGYLRGLLKRVSPDNSVDEAEQGITELCSLAGFKAETVDLEKLTDKVSQMRRIRELEELIVEEKLKTAPYQGSPYRAEFKEYTDNVFDTEDEKSEAFRSAGFYQIIEGMKAEMEQEAKESGSAQQGSVLWNEKMTEILGQCASGVVLDIETEGYVTRTESTSGRGDSVTNPETLSHTEER